ncbi:response regulator transcription factor [Rhizobium sp. Rhizsp42]|uniref:response regulator transcription factor n=1 Tax=Rhizobium sp. Rhizsp42 TaxID=3243034 RepID=UPI0039AF6A08
MDVRIQHRHSSQLDSSATIFVIDDDDEFRTGIVDLLQSLDMKTRAYGSAKAFLDEGHIEGPACILLDLRMPGLSGLELQQHLDRQGRKIPIIFITGHGDVPVAVQALKAGASDFIEKPFREDVLLGAISIALTKSAEEVKSASEADEVRALAATLTPREREVMTVVCKGLMNKQIAYELGISEVTVKIHRGNVMKKMKVRSVAELIRRTDLIVEAQAA